MQEHPGVTCEMPAPSRNVTTDSFPTVVGVDKEKGNVSLKSRAYRIRRPSFCFNIAIELRSVPSELAEGVTAPFAHRIVVPRIHAYQLGACGHP